MYLELLMKIFLKTIGIAFISFQANFVVAENYLVSDSEIIEVFNTGGNNSSFGVVTSGGSGPCIGKNIFFPITSAGDHLNGVSNIHSRAYATALTALSTGMNVDIYNYQDESNCNGAAFIKIKK